MSAAKIWNSPCKVCFGGSFANFSFMKWPLKLTLGAILFQSSPVSWNAPPEDWLSGVADSCNCLQDMEQYISMQRSEMPLNTWFGGSFAKVLFHKTAVYKVFLLKYSLGRILQNCNVLCNPIKLTFMGAVLCNCPHKMDQNICKGLKCPF